MEHGQASVGSQMVPGQTILIKDQLSLWPDQLWILDRGLDSNTGAFIYGNQRNVPYMLQLMAIMGCADDADQCNGDESPGRHWRAFPTGTAGPNSNTAEILRGLFDTA